MLVPFHNVEPFIEACVASILQQMALRPGIELVLLDDRSSDGSEALCQRLIADCGTAVRLLRHAENRGIAAARNTLVDAARGEYLWFVDSDDMLLPGAIDALQAIVEAVRPDVVLCDYLRGSEVRHATFPGAGRCHTRCIETLIAGTFAKRRLHLWSRVWRRDLFGEDIRFPDGAHFEDVAVVPRLLLRARCFYYAAEPWVFYRSRPGSIMARINKARAAFDRRGNDDMASALAGFGTALASAVPDAAPETNFVVARFVSREFAKIAKRLVRSRNRSMNWGQLRAELHRYRGAMESCSPLPFAQVCRQHLLSGNIGRGLELAFWLAIARPLPDVTLPTAVPGPGLV
ncbi:glycosyltransferase family A protein [Novosphingobium resinovorum]|uniref:glycosyltransferase family 2 protein n=1 Tax=Novosphingobium resinovorum TaxID=158500 RepID=UPI002ED551DA